jgi:predicted RNase H-like HicB family nuclease
VMQSYPIDVFWSDEDDIWIANVPDLALCTGHGSTPQEAVIEVEVAVEAWLEAANAEGRAIPVPSAKEIQA